MNATFLAVVLPAALLAGCTAPLQVVQGECGRVPAHQKPVCLQPTVHLPRELPARIRVDARCHWVHTGVQLSPSERYRFTIHQEERWVDWDTEADPVTGWKGDR